MVATTSAIRSGVTFHFDLSYSITKVTHVLNGRIRPIARPSDCVCPAWRMSNLVHCTPTPTCHHIRVFTVPGIRIAKWPADLAMFKHSTKQREPSQIYSRWKLISTATLAKCLGCAGHSTSSPRTLPTHFSSQHFPANSRAPCAAAVKANKVCAKSKWSV